MSNANNTKKNEVKVHFVPNGFDQWIGNVKGVPTFTLSTDRRWSPSANACSKRYDLRRVGSDEVIASDRWFAEIKKAAKFFANAQEVK